MLLHRIAIANLLSFGPEGIDLELRPLNVLIGPNGSGKSNLVEAISLLQAAPRLLADPVRNGGGVSEWLRKGEENTIAALEVVANDSQHRALRHLLKFTESSGRFELIEEHIWDANGTPGDGVCEEYYALYQNVAALWVDGQPFPLPEDVSREESILSQRKDPDRYPELTFLGEQFAKIRIYRDWSFGRDAPVRRPQKTDQRSDFLSEDCTNLALVLNQLRRKPAVKARILEMLNRLYSGIDDFDVNIVGPTAQVYLLEGDIEVFSTRLSDGTLRYLCLLAVLCHPDPPPLICIEEPELGLHPDVMPAICDLLREASERTQLIVTTHSDVLVDDLTNSPEDVVVCEKSDGQSTMRRLDADELKQWLEKYSLGELWLSGEIGGKRW